MDEMSLETYDGIVVPASALRQQRRKERYGSVEGLPDEERVDPDELERVMYKEMWWPILRLPRQRYERVIRPNGNEDGKPDWGAFGTVDFDRYRQDFDRLRYKAERLMDQQHDLSIMFEIISERIGSTVKYKILKLVRLGRLDVDDIENWDMWQLAKVYMRILRLQRQRYELIERSRKRRGEKDETLWRSVGC